MELNWKIFSSPMKSLELTKENINAVSLEMTRNKKLFDENINHVIGFMLKSFPEKRELLCKIKVLNIKSKSASRIDSEADVMEQIAMNLFSIKGIDEGDFMRNMLILFEDLSSFSRAFLVYFYKNSDLNPVETKEILDALIRLLLEKTRLEREFEELMNHFQVCDEEDEDKDVSIASDNECEEAIVGAELEVDQDHVSEESTNTAISLVSLNDPDEIKRLDTSLSILFGKGKKDLSNSELMTCTKVLDIMEVILENNYLGDSDIIPALLCISSSNQVIFKRVLSVVRTMLKKIDYTDKRELFEMFCYCLEWNSDLVKMTMLMVETCGDEFDWPLFFEIVYKNAEIDLGMVDRTYIPSIHLYKFLSSVEDLQRFLKIAKNMIKNETDINVLMELREEINDRPDHQCTAGIKNAIFYRIKALSQNSSAKNNKRSKHNDENLDDTV